MISNDPEFFEIFPWNKNFNTGIEIIDEQHKQLVNILNKLAGHLANRSNEITLNKYFDELAAYADYHFKTEEAIWSKHFPNDTWYTDHEATHLSFIEEVIFLKNNKDSRTLDSVIYDIVSFLSKWLAYHILDTDKRMALAVKEIESGNSIEEAKKVSNEKMNGSMKVLVDTVLNMYESLSTRTLDLMREKALRKQAEEALEQSEERWKFVLEGGVDNVWDWDIKNNQLEHSKDEISIFKISDDLSGINRKNSIIHPSDLEKVKSDFQDHLDGKTDFYVNKHRILEDNGAWSWILSRGKVVSRDNNGKALRMIGTHTNVTERELTSIIYKNSSQAMLISDANNNIISINPECLKMTGYTQEELLGKNPNILSSGKHDKIFYKNMWNDINSKGKWSGKIYNKRKDGEIYYQYIDISTVTDSDGSINHYFALFNDITEEEKYKIERVKQEKFLLQKSRMVQMGEMISMIAHQWRQPLSAISATSATLQMQLELDKFNLEIPQEYDKFKTSFSDKLTFIDTLVQNLSIIINDFRNFYKPNKESSNISITSPINKAMNIIKSSLESSNIIFEEKYESEKILNLYENEMMQVILNILKNAQDNFLEKRTTNPKIAISTKTIGDSTFLKICDNGGGIKEDILPNIFDPYYSTKSEYNGTGLGLYMCKIVVESYHNSKISAANKDDGVCFTIELNNKAMHL